MKLSIEVHQLDITIVECQKYLGSSHFHVQNDRPFLRMSGKLILALNQRMTRRSLTSCRCTHEELSRDYYLHLEQITT